MEREHHCFDINSILSGTENFSKKRLLGKGPLSEIYQGTLSIKSGVRQPVSIKKKTLLEGTPINSVEVRNKYWISFISLYTFNDVAL